MQTVQTGSTRPYLIRAIYDWCCDNGLTPYLAVHVDQRVQVPAEHVRNGEIVLNISCDATSALKLGNDWIEFKARFSGSVREIIVPVDHVLAIYAKENGQGMSFPFNPAELEAAQAASMKAVEGQSDPETEPEPPRPPGKPSLRRIK